MTHSRLIPVDWDSQPERYPAAVCARCGVFNGLRHVGEQFLCEVHR